MEQLVPRMFHIRKTVMKMLEDRGYLVTKEETEASLDSFKQRFAPDGNVRRELLTVMVRKKVDHMDKIFVFFPEDAKLGVKPIRKYCDMMRETEVSRAIIVVQAGGMTPFARTALAEMAPKLILETFTDIELLVNITEHVVRCVCIAFCFCKVLTNVCYCFASSSQSTSCFPQQRRKPFSSDTNFETPNYLAFKRRTPWLATLV